MIHHDEGEGAFVEEAEPAFLIERAGRMILFLYKESEGFAAFAGTFGSGHYQCLGISASTP